MGRWGRFDLAVAGEVLYIFRASDTSVFESAVQLFRTAAFLLNGDGDDTRCACGGEDAAKRDGAGCAGVLCFVYTPRYRGMGPAIRRAAAECGLAFRTVNRCACVPTLSRACVVLCGCLTRCTASLRRRLSAE